MSDTKESSEVQESAVDNAPSEEATLEEWKRHTRKHEDRAKALAAENKKLKAQLSEIQGEAGKSKTLEERLASLEEKLTDTEAQLEKKDRDLVAARVSSVKNVPARYISGDTEEEMIASADQFLADLQDALAAEEAKKRTGHVPSQGTGESRPEPSSLESGAERARAKYNQN